VAMNGVGFCSFSDNLSTKKLIKRRGNGSIIGVRSICSRREVGTVVRCSSSSKAVAPLESEGDGRRCMIEEEEEEGGGDVMRFKMSDFKVLDRVSIGLGGRVSQKTLLHFFFHLYLLNIVNFVVVFGY